MKVALVCLIVQCLLLLQNVNGEDYRENSPRAYSSDKDDEQQQSDERSTSHYNRLPEGANTVEENDYKNDLKKAEEGEEGEGKFFHKLKRFFRRPRQRIIRRRRPYSSPCRPRYVNNRGQGKVLWDTTVLNVYPGHGHGHAGYGGYNQQYDSSGFGPHFHYHPFGFGGGYYPHHKPHKPHRPQHYTNEDSNGESGETSDYSSSNQNSGNSGQGNQNTGNANNGNGGGGGYLNNGNNGGGGFLNNLNNGGGGGGYLNNGNGGGGGYFNNGNGGGGGGGYLNNGGGGGGYLNNGGGGGGYLNNGGGGGGYLNNGGGGGGGGYLNNGGGGGGGGYTYNDGINCDDAGGAFYEEIIYEQPQRPRPPNFGLGLLNLIRPPVVFYPGNVNPAPTVVNTPVLNTPVVTRPMTVTTTNIPGTIMQTNVDVFDPVYDNRPVTSAETITFDAPQQVPGVVGGVANTVNSIIQTLTGNYRPGRRITANRPVRYTNNRNRQRRF